MDERNGMGFKDCRIPNIRCRMARFEIWLIGFGTVELGRGRCCGAAPGKVTEVGRLVKMVRLLRDGFGGRSFVVQFLMSTWHVGGCVVDEFLAVSCGDGGVEEGSWYKYYRGD